jgi:hypothetical protein
MNVHEFLKVRIRHLELATSDCNQNVIAGITENQIERQQFGRRRPREDAMPVEVLLAYPDLFVGV